MKRPKFKRKPPAEHRYKCGLKPRDKVRLKRDIAVRDNGKPTGLIYSKGQIWIVLPVPIGEPAEDIWFQTERGGRHAWSDDESIYRTLGVTESG